MNHENSSSSRDRSDGNNSSNNERNLTKKKQQYLQQAIIDRAGIIKFEEDPEQYKKARKRLQNRESAVRSRFKKREEVETLEMIVRKLEQEKAMMELENLKLKQ